MYAKANLETTRLVVCAVGARDELTEGAGSWEPRFNVVLLGRSQVERAGHNVDDLVGETDLSMTSASA